MNIYAKLENVAIVVATFAPAAIISVEVDVTYATISTITIVNTVLNICSNVCALAVIFNVLLPLKYPLNTDDIDTKILLVIMQLMLVLPLEFESNYMQLYVLQK